MKICPKITTQITERLCYEDKCALWYDGKCADIVIAESLKEIANSAELQTDMIPCQL